MPSKQQYVVMADTTGKKAHQSPSLIRIDFRSPEPCDQFARRKGLHFPICTCMPCMSRYFKGKNAQGFLSVSMPVGWTPENPLKETV